MGNNSSKILVCDGVKELKAYLDTNKEVKICLYLAEKTKEAWDISTSRVYMNQIDKKFVYLPVNIKKDDMEAIREVYNIAEEDSRIVAINQTQPHKSNAVQKEWFKGQRIPDQKLVNDENTTKLIEKRIQKYPEEAAFWNNNEREHIIDIATELLGNKYISVKVILSMDIADVIYFDAQTGNIVSENEVNSWETANN